MDLGFKGLGFRILGLGFKGLRLYIPAEASRGMGGGGWERASTLLSDVGHSIL